MRYKRLFQAPVVSQIPSLKFSAFPFALGIYFLKFRLIDLWYFQTPHLRFQALHDLLLPEIQVLAWTFQLFNCSLIIWGIKYICVYLEK